MNNRGYPSTAFLFHHYSNKLWASCRYAYSLSSIVIMVFDCWGWKAVYSIDDGISITIIKSSYEWNNLLFSNDSLFTVTSYDNVLFVESGIQRIQSISATLAIIKRRRIVYIRICISIRCYKRWLFIQNNHYYNNWRRSNYYYSL